MEINGSTTVYGIIGSPIEHTMSPAIHNHISQALRINSVYVPFRADGNLKSIANGLHSLGVRGINVTVPYKTDIIKELCGTDPFAGAIGAVNTLKYTEEGYFGYNTDVMGLDRELESEGLILKERDIVLLGAGGAARAAAFLCLSKSPSSITIVNRTVEKAEGIRSSLLDWSGNNGIDIDPGDIRTLALDDIGDMKGSGYIVFQCTNVGLYPDVDSCIVNEESFFKKTEAGIDLIYRPEKTRFMKNIENAGGCAYNGLKMLIYQAVCAYEIWNDVKVPKEVTAGLYKLLAREG